METRNSSKGVQGELLSLLTFRIYEIDGTQLLLSAEI